MKGYTLLPTDDIPSNCYESAFQYATPGSDMSRYKSIFDYTSNSSFHLNILKQGSGRKPDKLITTLFHYVIVTCSYIFLILTAPFTVWFCFKRLAQHERVIIFRLGRRLPIKGPGIICVFPWMDHWKKVDLRMRAFIIPPQQLLIADGSIVELSAEIRFRICDIVKSMTSIQNLDEAVRMLGQSLLINTAQQKTLAHLKNEKARINKEVQLALNKSTTPWGLEISQVEISMPKVFQVGTGEPSPVNSLLSSLQSFLNPGSTGLFNPTSSVPLQPKHDLTKDSAISKIMTDKVFPAINGSELDPNGGIFKLEVPGPDGGTFWLNTKTGQTFVGERLTSWGNPDIEVTLSSDDFLSLINGHLSPFQAYISGQVQISGNTALIMGLQNIIKQVKVCNIPLNDTPRGIQIV